MRIALGRAGLGMTQRATDDGERATGSDTDTSKRVTQIVDMDIVDLGQPANGAPRLLQVDQACAWAFADDHIRVVF